jgi:hypothetical protein
MDVEETYVSLSPFDAADIGSVKAADMSKSFLGEVETLPKGPQGETECR